LNLIDVDTLPVDAVVLETRTMDEEEILDEEELETPGEVFQILNNLENGEIDDSLPRTSAEDVAFDMDEVISSIEENDYYTDSTTSDSDNDSEGPSEEDVDNFEL
jgi:hypothetical protein